MRLFAFCCAIALASVSLNSSAADTATNPQAEKKPAAAEKKKPVDWAALFKMHWTDRVKQFAEQNKKGYQEKNVVLLGDSITEGFNVDKFFPDRHVLNRGIGADIIGNDLPESDHRGLLRRMKESVYDCNPSDVFILIGINDLGMGHKPAQLEAGYRELLTELKKNTPDVHIHVQSVLPCRGNFAKHNANVNDVNQRLQKLAKEFGDDYVDLHSQMTDDKGELKKDFTPEGLHLKDPAYKVWKTQVHRTMNW